MTEGTATPAQLDPQTIHLNAAQTRYRHRKGHSHNQLAHLLCPRQTRRQELLSQTPGTAALHPLLCPSARGKAADRGRECSSFLNRQNFLQPLLKPPPAPSNPTAPSDLAHPHTASCARLLQTADIPPETAHLVRCHNPWPSEDVLFCHDGALPAFVTGIPALSSGPELWYAVHNHRPEPLQLHVGRSIGVLEVVHLAEAPATASPSSKHPTNPCQPPLPEYVSPLQQQQLNELFKEFQDVFSQGDDDLGNTPLLEHGIGTHGPPLCQPYRRQNPAVRREEMTQGTADAVKSTSFVPRTVHGPLQ